MVGGNVVGAAVVVVTARGRVVVDTAAASVVVVTSASAAVRSGWAQAAAVPNTKVPAPIHAMVRTHRGEPLKLARFPPMSIRLAPSLEEAPANATRISE